MSPLPWMFRPAQDLLRFGPLTVDKSQVRCAMSFLVVRLVPEAPVNGATFATYLDGLALQVFDANNPETPLSGLAYSSQLSLFRWQGQGQMLSSVSAPTRDSAAVGDTTLTFNSTDGIAVGSYVFSSDRVFGATSTTISPGDNLQVAEVTRPCPATLGNNPGVKLVSMAASSPVPTLPLPVLEFSLGGPGGGAAARLLVGQDR